MLLTDKDKKVIILGHFSVSILFVPVNVIKHNNPAP